MTARDVDQVIAAAEILAGVGAYRCAGALLSVVAERTRDEFLPAETRQAIIGVACRVIGALEGGATVATQAPERSAGTTAGEVN